MNPIRRAFALATRIAPGEEWQFISQAATGGNLMRTTSPFHARTWPSVAEIEDWIAIREAQYPALAGEKHSKLQIVPREYAVIPVALAMAAPVRSLVVCSLESKQTSWRADGAEEPGEYHLR